MGVAALALALLGCTKTSHPLDPGDWSPYGAHAGLVVDGVSFDGELLACEHGFIYLYVARADGSERWYALSRRNARKIHIERTAAPPAWTFAAWTALGAASSASHGYFALLSGSVWLVAGGSVYAAELYRDEFSGYCDELRPYARYPLGLPDAMRPRFFVIGDIIANRRLTVSYSSLPPQRACVNGALEIVVVAAGHRATAVQG